MAHRHIADKLLGTFSSLIDNAATGIADTYMVNTPGQPPRKILVLIAWLPMGTEQWGEMAARAMEVALERGEMYDNMKYVD